MEEQFRELVRVGVVTNIYPERGTVRVHLVDADDQVSYELSVVYQKTGKDKEYWMPDIGEHVVCLFSGQGMEQGFCAWSNILSGRPGACKQQRQMAY